MVIVIVNKIFTEDFTVIIIFIRESYFTYVFVTFLEVSL